MTLPPRRLTPVERFIAEVLDRHGARYGLEILDLAAGQIKRGTLYVTLGRMEQKGLVSSVSVRPASRTPRHYDLTHRGSTVLGVERSLDEKLAKVR